MRLTAFFGFNGFFGHKPTGSLVPGSGQYPIAENEALTDLTTGPLAWRGEIKIVDVERKTALRETERVDIRI